MQVVNLCEHSLAELDFYFVRRGSTVNISSNLVKFIPSVSAIVNNEQLPLDIWMHQHVLVFLQLT
jgi:hypothetical protein